KTTREHDRRQSTTVGSARRFLGRMAIEAGADALPRIRRLHGQIVIHFNAELDGPVDDVDYGDPQQPVQPARASHHETFTAFSGHDEHGISPFTSPTRHDY